MKRIIIILVCVSAMAAAILLLTRERRQTTSTPREAGLKTPVQESLKPPPVRVVEKTKTDATAGTPSQELEKIKEYIAEFNVPPKLADQLLEAAKKGSVINQGNNREPTAEQAKRAGADPKTLHLSAGYKVFQPDFDERIAAALPETTPEEPAKDEEEPSSAESEGDSIRALKSEALAILGFSAMLQLNYEQAERAFSTLLRYYGDSEAAPMVRLELARLFLEQDRIAEARDAVVEAIAQYHDDEEYVEIAEDLRKTIEEYET